MPRPVVTVALMASVVAQTALENAREGLRGSELEAAARDVREAVESALAEAGDARSPAGLRGAPDGAADRMFELGDRLEGVDAPESTRPAKEDLVRALDDRGTDLQEAATDAGRGDVRGVLSGLGDLDVEPLGQLRSASR